MARTKNPSAATRKAWLTRKRNAAKAGASATVTARAFGMDTPKGEREYPEQKANPLWKEPKPEHDWEKPDPDGKRYDAFRPREKAWIAAMREAVSLGEVSLKDAVAKGFRRAGDDDMVELPGKLYHVTTAAGAVMREGLKTRMELGQENGVGLGGGDSDAVSFTVSPEIAKGIRRALLDAHAVMSGEMTLADLDADAAKGQTTGGKPFADRLADFFPAHALYRSGYDPHPKTGAMKITDMPAGAKPRSEGWMGGDGVRRISGYYDKLVPGSKREMEIRWDYFRAYTLARAEAGGPMDPMFFGSDPIALARQKVSDIRVVEVTPRPGTRGFRMSALGEIRIWTGKVVQKQRLVPEED